MCPRFDVIEDHGFEVARGNAGKVEKHVKSISVQVLENCQSPGNIRAPITDKDCLLDARHLASASRTYEGLSSCQPGQAQDIQVAREFLYDTA
jgi:hypothetical protein